MFHLVLLSIKRLLSFIISLVYNIPFLIPYQRFTRIIRATQGALIVASTLQIILGFSGLWRNVVRSVFEHHSTQILLQSVGFKYVIELLVFQVLKSFICCSSGWISRSWPLRVRFSRCKSSYSLNGHTKLKTLNSWNHDSVLFWPGC